MRNKSCSIVNGNWSSDPLQLDVQPKPWHNRQDGLGVLEPEAVTRVQRFSLGPHPQSAQPTRSRGDGTNEEAVDGMENRTRRGFPHRPQPLICLPKKKKKALRLARRHDQSPDFRIFS